MRFETDTDLTVLVIIDCIMSFLGSVVGELEVFFRTGGLELSFWMFLSLRVEIVDLCAGVDLLGGSFVMLPCPINSFY